MDVYVTGIGHRRSILGVRGAPAIPQNALAGLRARHLIPYLRQLRVELGACVVQHQLTLSVLI